MGNVLVVSYSLSGTTRIVADELVRLLAADSHEIVEARKRKGVVDYLLAGFESLAKGVPAIVDSCEPSAYDMVVLGTPVWVGSMASPMRSFLLAHRREFKKVACFCTMSGRGANNTLREMKALTGSKNAPTFSALESNISNGSYLPRLETFAASVRQFVDGSVTAIA
jgi:flavodoxin